MLCLEDGWFDNMNASMSGLLFFYLYNEVHMPLSANGKIPSS